MLAFLQNQLIQEVVMARKFELDKQRQDHSWDDVLSEWLTPYPDVLERHYEVHCLRRLYVEHDVYTATSHLVKLLLDLWGTHPLNKEEIHVLSASVATVLTSLTDENYMFAYMYLHQFPLMRKLFWLNPAFRCRRLQIWMDEELEGKVEAIFQQQSHPVHLSLLHDVVADHYVQTIK